MATAKLNSAKHSTITLAYAISAGIQTQSLLTINVNRVQKMLDLTLILTHLRPMNAYAVKLHVVFATMMLKESPTSLKPLLTAMQTRRMTDVYVMRELVSDVHRLSLTLTI